MTRSGNRRPWLLASDIDNTLTGDPAALRRLADRIRERREAGALMLFLTTGRRLDQVIDGFAAEGIPAADAVISQVGTEIFLPPYRLDEAPLEAWSDRLHARFERARALRFLEGIEGLEMQPDRFNTPLKVSCYLDGAPDPDAAAEQVAERVASESDAYQVVWSSGRDLDILPAAAGKGRAIEFLVGHLGLAPRGVLVAGDSGNDRSMFEAFGCGVVVGNARPELLAIAGEPFAEGVYFARDAYAAGVEEGLAHFGVWG